VWLRDGVLSVESLGEPRDDMIKIDIVYSGMGTFTQHGVQNLASANVISKYFAKEYFLEKIFTKTLAAAKVKVM